MGDFLRFLLRLLQFFLICLPLFLNPFHFQIFGVIGGPIGFGLRMLSFFFSLEALQVVVVTFGLLSFGFSSGGLLRLGLSGSLGLGLLGIWFGGFLGFSFGKKVIGFGNGGLIVF